MDYRQCDPTTLATLICKYVEDFDDQFTRDTLTVDRLMDEIANGRAIIDADEHAIAVVRPEGWREVNGGSVLWLLFVDSNWRATGIGLQLVTRMQSTYTRDLPMILICHGEKRVRFFERCGFKVKEVIDAGTVMISNLTTARVASNDPQH
jgi:GNAT superfamily N-acetyltransferase